MYDLRLSQNPEQQPDQGKQLSETMVCCSFGEGVCSERKPLQADSEADLCEPGQHEVTEQKQAQHGRCSLGQVVSSMPTQGVKASGIDWTSPDA